jgi:hypothetical protein
MELDRREITEVRIRNLLRAEGLAEPNAVEYGPGEITLFWDQRKVAIVIEEIPEGCVEIEDLEGSVRLADGKAGDLAERLAPESAGAGPRLADAFVPVYERFEAEPGSVDRDEEQPMPGGCGTDDDIPF